MKKYLGQLRRALVGIKENANDKMAAAPRGVRATVLSQSVDKQDVSYYRLGDGPKKVLFVSAIHGNEVGTVKLAYELLTYLHAHLDEYKDFTFFIIPCLNVDGYRLALSRPDYLNGGRIGRFNANNVDLNRNFPTQSFQSRSAWTHGKNYQERTEVFCGDSPASEPELQALLKLIKDEKITTYYAFHSAGRDVTGNDLPLAQKMAKAFGEKTGFHICTPKEWKELRQTGTAKEWCDEQKIINIEIEASTRWGSDWKNQRAGILASLELLR